MFIIILCHVHDVIELWCWYFCVGLRAQSILVCATRHHSRPAKQQKLLLFSQWLAVCRSGGQWPAGGEGNLCCQWVIFIWPLGGLYYFFWIHTDRMFVFQVRRSWRGSLEFLWQNCREAFRRNMSGCLCGTDRHVAASPAFREPPAVQFLSSSSCVPTRCGMALWEIGIMGGCTSLFLRLHKLLLMY